MLSYGQTLSNNTHMTLKKLFIFSLPSILSSMVEPISGIVDTSIVGHLDTKMLAAMSVGVTIIATFTYVFNFIIHTTTTNISKNSLDKEALNAQVSLSLTVGLMVGVVASLFLYFFKPILYSFMKIDIDFGNIVDSYYNVRACGHVFVILYLTSLSVLRGKKDVNLAFLIVAITTIINIIATTLLVFYFNLNLLGAALGTVFSNLCGFILCMYFIYKDKFKFALNLNKAHFASYSKDSFALFLRSVFLSTVFLYSVRSANIIGKNALATYQILINLWLFVSFFIDGIAMSATILFSEQMGGDQNKISKMKFKKMYYDFLKITLLIGSILTIIYVLFNQFIFLIFTKDLEVLNLLTFVWPIVCLAQIPNTISFLYDGILFGIFEFRYLSRRMIEGVVLIALPIIYYSTYNGHKSLYIIFVAHFSLNIFRMITGQIKINKFLRRC